MSEIEIRNGFPVRSINIDTTEGRTLIIDFSTEAIGRLVDLYHKEEPDLLSFDTSIAYYVTDDVFFSEDEDVIVNYLLSIDDGLLNKGESIEFIYI